MIQEETTKKKKKEEKKETEKEAKVDMQYNFLILKNCYIQLKNYININNKYLFNITF